ncbi:MAG: TIGR02301 family protein [Pseudomonadota bacterium]|nr:TIGR02301 family protein [Pseudomonadota bacterium]
MPSYSIPARRLIAAVVFFALLAAGPAKLLAQSGQDERPYDAKLLRLSEILGAIHYLRELCGADEGQLWRDQMRDLLRSEGTSAIRRARLVQEFNKGYRGYRRTYRTCTESAQLAVDRFMEEGAKLSNVMIREGS